MSAVFNDTTNYRGLVQLYEREIGAQRGYVSSDTNRLKEYAADANMAFDEFVQEAIQSSGEWQWDDSNHTDHPIIRTNIVSGQRDYLITADQDGNLVLDFYRVRLADASGNYSDITPRDLQSETAFDYFDTATGLATEYDKTGNGLILGLIPNYNATNGLEIYINREASYFTYADTTKKPGVPGIFHRWFVIRPAEDYARRNSSENYQAIRAERLEMQRSIGEYYSSRNRDVPKRMVVAKEDNR